jgi:hypothetical protein
MLLNESKIRALVREMLMETMGRSMGYADPMQEGDSFADSANAKKKFYGDVAKILEKQKGVSASVATIDTEEDDQAVGLKIKSKSGSGSPIVTHKIGKKSVPGIFKSEDALYSAAKSAVIEARKLYKDVPKEQRGEYLEGDVEEFLGIRLAIGTTEEVNNPGDVVYELAHSPG